MSHWKLHGSRRKLIEDRWKLIEAVVSDRSQIEADESRRKLMEAIGSQMEADGSCRRLMEAGGSRWKLDGRHVKANRSRRKLMEAKRSRWKLIEDK